MNMKNFYLCIAIIAIAVSGYLGYKLDEANDNYDRVIKISDKMFEDYSMSASYVFCIWDTLSNVYNPDKVECNAKVLKQEFTERWNKYYDAGMTTWKAYN